jgi:protein-tyrosine-phosphatase
MVEKKKVLVLGHGTRAFLAVIRSLGRLGLDVHVAMCPPEDLALKSKYVKHRHDIPTSQAAGTTTPSWLDEMTDLLRRLDFSLVLPCDDQSMIPVQQHRTVLRELAPVYAYRPETYALAFSKLASTRLAENLGIPVPPRIEISSRSTSADVLSRLSLPIVLKPPSSFDENDPEVRREVVRVRTEPELVAGLKDFGRFEVALAQENFIGIGVGVELLAREGDILVAFQHERVHEPPEGGGSSYRRSVELNPEMLEATRKLIAALNYTGVAMVEFKFDRESRQWVFIEINGRFWGSLPLAISSGVDFPAYLYQMMIEGRTEFPTRYRVGVHSRSLVDDYHWLAANLRADHDDPTQVTVPLPAIAAEIGNVIRGRERIDTLARDDPAPGLAEIGMLLRRVTAKILGSVKARFKRRRLPRKQAVDLRREVKDAKVIGFVCYGNICRSPFAQAYAEATFDRAITIWSGGFHGAAGRASPAIAVSVARQMGIDLERHRSRVIDERMVSKSDLIFVFDDRNWDAMMGEFPEARHKVFLLSAAMGKAMKDISDPYGGSEREFRRTYQEIRRAVDAVSALVRGD